MEISSYLCKKYKLEHKIGGSEGKFIQRGYGRSVTCSLTPGGDPKIGHYVARDVIKMIEANKRELKKKKNQ